MYPDKEVYTSELDNSSAIGASLVFMGAMTDRNVPEIDMGLKKWDKF